MNFKILLSIVSISLALGTGFYLGYSFGFGDGIYHRYDSGYPWNDGWNAGYSNGFVSGYQESIIWYPVYSKDIYIKYYNNSVWNYKNGTSAEESFNKLTHLYYERRK